MLRAAVGRQTRTHIDDRIVDELRRLGVQQKKLFRQGGGMLQQEYATLHGTGWCTQRWFFIEIGGLYGHPRTDAADLLRLGTVRGLLVWDAERRTGHLEWPREDEAWTSPGASVRDGRLLIHASRARMHVDVPARTIPLEQAFGAAP